MTTDSGAAKSRNPLVIGHRGASAAFPENTLAAFRGAADAGADWVELDVRRTADGALVVHHDPVADGAVIVGTARADLPERIPTLAAALALCVAVDLGVNVEIKSDPDEPDFDPDYAVVDAVLALLAGDDVPRGSRLLVTSFDPACVGRVRALAPDIPTGQLAFDLSDRDGILERAAAAGHVSVNPWDPFVDAALVEAAHGLGLAVYPWTVDAPERMAELLALGVDGIITNVPDVLRGLLPR